MVVIISKNLSECCTHGIQLCPKLKSVASQFFPSTYSVPCLFPHPQTHTPRRRHPDDSFALSWFTTLSASSIDYALYIYIASRRLTGDSSNSSTHLTLSTTSYCRNFRAAQRPTEKGFLPVLLTSAACCPGAIACRYLLASLGLIVS